MSSRNVREAHNKHLRDPEVAAEYINQALASKDVAIILMAMRNVVDAQEGGVASIAEKSKLGRESMYKMLSSKGNPKLSSLISLFNVLGLKLEVTPETYINWANDWLRSKGYSLQNDPEVLLETPWSNVIRFSTAAEDFYLKQTPQLIYIEAEIIKLLKNTFNANVASLIISNEKLHCFLMRDAGPTLRKYLKANFDAKVICQAIAQFGTMQRSVENNLEYFLDLGVPDWRLDKLPQLYDEIINQTDFLIANGLNRHELQMLHNLREKVVEKCVLLSQYRIPETLVQPDCNTNNILINPKTKEMTIIDLGEIAIAHPFLSLANFLYQATIHECIKESDPTYNQIQDVYFDNWLGFATRSQLLDAMQLIKKIHPIYNVLFHYRLMLCVDRHDYDLYYANKPNHIAKYFKEYISSSY